MAADMTPLLEGSQKMNIDMKSEQLKLFDSYLNLLLEWNQKFNLTAIKDPREILVQHFLDSISLLKLGIIQEDSKVLDMGAGAGFPGIPLKIMLPEISLTLIDSVKKKVVFLEEVINRLGLKKTSAIHGRAEELGRALEQREAYDTVVSRAVAELRVLSEYCLPFVKTGGFFLAHKGPGAALEIENAKNAFKVLGGEFIECRQIEIPFSERIHNLVVVRKAKKTPKSYPRAAGKPKKQPL
ncbi:MAG: 16S rRNA (guanine(527)-N(7))-methyltransferase RsmG [Caldicoprobacterales bacterium]|jgi:16S rRNA (guanine527-N7)-methyltransferase